MKEDRNWGEERLEDRTGRGLRKGNGGDTGRNDEHKGKTNHRVTQFYQKTTYVLSSYYSLL